LTKTPNISSEISSTKKNKKAGKIELLEGFFSEAVPHCNFTEYHPIINSGFRTNTRNISNKHNKKVEVSIFIERCLIYIYYKLIHLIKSLRSLYCRLVTETYTSAPTSGQRITHVIFPISEIFRIFIQL